MSKSIFRVEVLAALVVLLAACSPAATATPPAAAASAYPAANATPTTTGIMSPPVGYPGTLPSTTSGQFTAGPAAAQPSAVAPTNAAAASGGAQYILVAGKSTASYKVREQLARLNLPSDAIGKTDQVSGSIVLKTDGSIDTANSQFSVDLASLQTDSSMRDGYVRGNILQTDQYPKATFIPKQITGLASPLPQSGQVAFKVSGDLTIHNVTKPVSWDVTGQVQADLATGVATTTFKFEDFGLNQPQVPVVLSVVDSITLEVDLTLQKAA